MVHLAQALQQRACPRLTCLNLGANWIGVEGCASLMRPLRHGDCPRLSSLNVSGNRIRNEGCAHLACGLGGCVEIEQLYLSRNEIDSLA